MNLEQAAFLAQWQEDCERISAQARDVVAKAEEVQNRGERLAYAEITKAADSLIRKDVRLTRDQAVARVLQQRPELYSAYDAEHSLRLRMSEVTDRNYRRRVNKAAEDREVLLDSCAMAAEQQAAFEEARKP